MPYKNPEYQKSYQRERYSRLKSKYKISAQANHIKSRIMILEYLLENPCIICGEKDPVCLEFHHRDPKEKEGNIGSMVKHSGRGKIMEEIKKCDVLCSNCHKRFHNKEYFDKLFYILNNYISVFDGKRKK